MRCGSCIRWTRREMLDSNGNKLSWPASKFGFCASPIERKPWPYWRTSAEDQVMVHETHGEGCLAGKEKRLTR